MELLVLWIKRALAATAWGMTPPAPYGAFHLIFFLCGLALCVFAAWRLRGLDGRKSRRLLIGIGIFLAVCEIYKQLFYFFYIGHGSYQWWIFPFQLCSIPMYFCIIAPLLKAGRLQKGMYDFMLLFNLLGGFISFLEPSGLVHEYWTLTVHAFLWHLTLIFVGLYLGFSGKAGTALRDYRSAVGTFLGLCLAAFGINLALWKVSGGDINMFFIGPKNSPLIVFSSIAERFGWYVSTLLYIPALCLGAFLVFLLFRRLSRRLGVERLPQRPLPNSGKLLLR